MGDPQVQQIVIGRGICILFKQLTEIVGVQTSLIAQVSEGDILMQMFFHKMNC